jgi:hypothetical protein
MIVNIYFHYHEKHFRMAYTMVVPVSEKSADNSRQSEIDISHNIFLDPSMNVCVIDEILSPMYEDGNCKSPSFRLSYDGMEEEEQIN